MQVNLESGYILHSRPFRNTSLILDCLTLHHGRLSLVARGVRSARSTDRALLQPFHPLLFSWRGKSAMKTMIQVERGEATRRLVGVSLYAGFYLNELVCRIVPEHDPSETLYDIYEWSLSRLADGDALEPVLRQFEFSLLQLLGYMPDLTLELMSGTEINALKEYYCDPESGLLESSQGQFPERYSGRALLAIANEDYSEPETLRAAKRLARQLLKPLLGEKPLKSRELFANIRPS